MSRPVCYFKGVFWNAMMPLCFVALEVATVLQRHDLEKSLINWFERELPQIVFANVNILISNFFIMSFYFVSVMVNHYNYVHIVFFYQNREENNTDLFSVSFIFGVRIFKKPWPTGALYWNAFHVIRMKN